MRVTSVQTTLRFSVLPELSVSATQQPAALSAGTSRSTVYTGRKINSRVVLRRTHCILGWSRCLYWLRWWCWWDHMDGSDGCDAANAASLLCCRCKARAQLNKNLLLLQQRANCDLKDASLTSQPDLCSSDVNSNSTNNKD